MSANKIRGKLRRELRRVENGAVPSSWLVKRCWRDETSQTLKLRRKVFPNLCEPESLAFNMSSLNQLTKIYFNPRVVEQFNKASLFYKHIMGDEVER